MIKVQILTHCEHCDGEAYLPIGEAESYSGNQYTRYQACPQCEGSGKQAKWISLNDFLEMLTKVAAQDPLEPGWLELVRKRPVSQYQDSPFGTDIRKILIMVNFLILCQTLQQHWLHLTLPLSNIGGIAILSSGFPLTARSR